MEKGELEEKVIAIEAAVGPLIQRVFRSARCAFSALSNRRL